MGKMHTVKSTKTHVANIIIFILNYEKCNAPQNVKQSLFIFRQTHQLS